MASSRSPAGVRTSRLPTRRNSAAPEPRFDVAELVAERRLREVQPIARAREAAEFGDSRYEAQVADFEIHQHETISSS